MIAGLLAGKIKPRALVLTHFGGGWCNTPELDSVVKRLELSLAPHTAVIAADDFTSVLVPLEK